MSSPYDGLAPNTPFEPIKSKPIIEPIEAPGDEEMGKGLFQSKTFWVNLLMSVASLAVYVQDSALVADNPQIVAGIGAAVGVVNIILRLLTKEPIKFKK